MIGKVCNIESKEPFCAIVAMVIISCKISIQSNTIDSSLPNMCITNCTRNPSRTLLLHTHCLRRNPNLALLLIEPSSLLQTLIPFVLSSIVLFLRFPTSRHHLEPISPIPPPPWNSLLAKDTGAAAPCEVGSRHDRSLFYSLALSCFLNNQHFWNYKKFLLIRFALISFNKRI